MKYNKKMKPGVNYLEFKRNYILGGDHNKPAPDISSIDEEPGLVYMPYQVVTTHVIVSDKSGTRRYRQVSRWFLFKMWLYKVFHPKKVTCL